MTQIVKSALVPYPASTMYGLVNDVASYPLFLPWCGGSEILEQNEQFMLARVDIKKAGVNQSFTTENELMRDKSIKMQLRDGPFKTLQGEWLFSELKKGMVDGCKIELNLQYEFSNRFTAALLGGVFEPIANMMVDSFVKRAHSLYQGKS